MHSQNVISSNQLQHLYEGYCNMPLLWYGDFFELNQFDIALELDQCIDALKIPQNKRLGKLAEDLFSFWLSTTSRFSKIVENLQIIENKRTIGEIDVLVFDKKYQNYLHLELVTKFYLYNPAYDINDVRAWIGPNRNDSLLEKLTKLKERQLPLLNQKITRQILVQYLSEKSIITQQVLFKANLFVPLNCNLKLTIFNSDCVVGNYLTFPQFKELHSKDKLYFCPAKQDWLRHPNTQIKWNDFEESHAKIEKFMNTQQSLMVWVKYKETYQRYIVVPYTRF